MNVREVLQDVFEAWNCENGDSLGDLAEYSAPIIEKAARAAIQSGYGSGHNDAMGTGPCDGSEERGLAVFIAAIVEGS